MIKQITILIFILASGLVNFIHGQEAQIHIRQDHNKTVIRNSNGLSSFDVELRGKIELTDDDKDIKSMSPDGYLEVRKTVFGSRRTLIIASEGSTLRRDYYEGRNKIPFEPAGKAWLSEILPELVRSTTIGAESRVTRFYKSGGTSAVLSEISRLQSNHVKSHYANLLMKQGVSQRDYVTIIDRMASTMDSNHYLAAFLNSNMDKFVKSNEALEAAFRATNNMDSDHYKTEVIKQGLSEPVSLGAVKIILRSTGNMDSDHYKTEVLKSLLDQNNLTDEIIKEMINTSRSIDSDHYRTIVLNNALNKEGLSNASFQSALESIKEIDSDHYKSEVLKSLISKPISEELQLTLIDLTRSIDSDHYTSIVLEEVMRKQQIDNQVFSSLINRAGSIDSDHYSSTVMKDALRRNLNEANLITLLESAGQIDSDHYLTEVLVAAAPQVRNGSNAVKEAFRKAARNISSETYYGRAMRALDNN